MEIAIEYVSDYSAYRQELQRCNQTVLGQPQPNDGRVYCNATWDTMQCWTYQLAGTTAHQNCPGYVTLSNPTVHSEKTCYPNGTWFRHPETGEVWTNYTMCFDKELMEEHQRVLSIYYYGFGFSIILLVISILIFSCLRQLQCVRVTLHKHLFFSYVLSGVMWILYYSLVSSDLDVLRKNELWCQALHVLTHYTTVCSYAWMFCEGFYLHALIVITFVKDTRLIRICYIIGWIVPIIPCLIYTTLRANDQDANKRCWTDETLLNWILAGPVSVSLILNLAFSVNIMRILISKLRSVQNNETQQTRRAVKATLILIPLLGLQYIAFPFKPDPGDRGEYEYSMTTAFFVSFQGAFVSLVFCFFNGEVLSLIKRLWQDFKDRRNPRHPKGSRRKSTTSSYILQELPLTSARHNSSGKVGRKDSKLPLPETHILVISKELCLEEEVEEEDN
ncbi:hypothetical protein CHS0354_006369 [Potamilus streckersoni]|uniref:Calcitonin receptor n=1 Tax=Potamilus streckersoni TaxID=2493646 RepID=A0AAE0VU20_9BIVA|nr:hypothetical protein CHS0354_006369 [Potamilus streckersoni]